MTEPSEPRSNDPREAILEAARAIYRTRGFARTTLKATATAAGVAPDVIKRYYKSRDDMVAAALKLPFDPYLAIPQLLAPGVAGVGERVVRFSLDVLSDEAMREDLFTLLRAGAATGKAGVAVRVLLEESIDRVAKGLRVPDARLRVELVSSFMLGVGINRYVLHIEPIASMPRDDLVAVLAPTVQRWLDPRKPLTS
jgi:AcrR family transcriptional regulator